MIRKIAISLNCLLLAILMTITPVQRAQAAIAIPLGLGAGAGLYVVGGLAVAGLATIVGLEHGDQIREHSLNVWNGTTQTVKDSMDWSLNQWQELQNDVLPIGDALYHYIKAKIPELAANIIAENYTGTIPQGNVTFGTFDSQYGLYVSHKFTNQTLNWKEASGNTWQANNGSIIARNGQLTFAGYSTPVPLGSEQAINNTIRNLTTLHALASLWNVYSTTNELQVISVNPEYDALYNSGVSSTSEAWEDMRDAGLVLPNTGVTTYSGDTLVNYDAQAGQYVGIDGNVYNPADLTWKFPTIKTRTGTADIPAGTYVDSPALTGNPAIDEALINNPAIPKTTTNINTGVTYANPDIATDIPINPPITDVPPAPTTGLNLLPLQIAGSTLTNKFPFSIPWDLIKQLSVFNVQPEAPVFNIDIQQYLTFPELGISIPFKMDLDLSFLDPVAAIARWGTIISFDIALILMLRRLLPE